MNVGAGGSFCCKYTAVTGLVSNWKDGRTGVVVA